MGYRENVLVPAAKDSKHPTNYGFTMQVHHLLSTKGVKDSGHYDELKAYNYNINLAGNLVALPSTLQGACHLKVQLHRANHTTLMDTNDNDGEHPLAYHEQIEVLVKKACTTINKRCDEQKQKLKGVQRYMDYHSELVLKDIKAYILPLTSVYKAFPPGGVGCLGVTSVPELRHKLKDNPSGCTCNNRNHSAEFKNYPQGNYTLKRGQ
ncbi:Putative uncharacterized protein [Moritella viscosa]|uniref:AHH domain-containing protein n=1 Tax=Moritella viscosa TaxID=80854 RepID=UPI00090F6A6A|nr:AHH domain-containing protein [Moritella viscosa]SGY92386.1 Putative uncharacterized protein [Moritella viscosa]